MGVGITRGWSTPPSRGSECELNRAVTFAVCGLCVFRSNVAVLQGYCCGSWIDPGPYAWVQLFHLQEGGVVGGDQQVKKIEGGTGRTGSYRQLHFSALGKRGCGQNDNNPSDD